MYEGLFYYNSKRLAWHAHRCQYEWVALWILCLYLGFFCWCLVFVCAHMHVFVQMSSMLFLVVRQCFSVLMWMTHGEWWLLCFLAELCSVFSLLHKITRIVETLIISAIRISHYAVMCCDFTHWHFMRTTFVNGGQCV